MADAGRPTAHFVEFPLEHGGDGVAGAPATPASSANVGAVARTVVGTQRGRIRDAACRFAAKRRADGATGGRRARTATSHNGRRSHTALVRALVVLEHKVGRLEADTRRVEWHDPEKDRPANMIGILKKQDAGVGKRVRAVTAALLHFAARRVTPARRELAARVAFELGAPFDWRSLYRAPYASMWRGDAVSVGTHVADGAATMTDRSRWSRREIVHRLRVLGVRHGDLLATRKIDLVAESVADGWTAIPDHRRCTSLVEK